MTLSLCFVGVDPGISKGSKRGAIAFLPENSSAAVFDLPVLDEELTLISIVLPFTQNYRCIARIEEEQVWHGDVERGSTWNIIKLIRHQQMCVSVLRTLGAEVEVILPAVWKGALGLKGEGKQGTISFTLQHYPELHERIEYKSRGKWITNNNRADAVAIGHSVKVERERAAA